MQIKLKRVAKNSNKPTASLFMDAYHDAGQYFIIAIGLAQTRVELEDIIYLFKLLSSITDDAIYLLQINSSKKYLHTDELEALRVHLGSVLRAQSRKLRGLETL